MSYSPQDINIPILTIQQNNSDNNESSSDNNESSSDNNDTLFDETPSGNNISPNFDSGMSDFSDIDSDDEPLSPSNLTSLLTTGNNFSNVSESSEDDGINDSGQSDISNISDSATISSGMSNDSFINTISTQDIDEGVINNTDINNDTDTVDENILTNNNPITYINIPIIEESTEVEGTQVEGTEVESENNINDNQILTDEIIESFDGIVENDKNFMKNLINHKKPIDNNNLLIGNLHNIIHSKVNLKDYIGSLLKLYDNVKDVGIYISTKYILAKNIAELFKTVPIQKYFDKSFLNDEFVDYLIKKHLFYDNILSKLLLREWGLNFFDFKACAIHIPFYKICCQKLNTRLNLFLQNSNYYSYRLSDFTTYIAFIKLMINLIDTSNSEDSKSLLDTFMKLFLNILGQLYATINTSRATLETLTIVSESYTSKYIDIRGSSNIKRLEVEISKCNNTINQFFSYNVFTKLFCESLKDFNICKDFSHKNYSELLSIIPSLTNNWHFSNTDLDELIKTIYLDKIDDIFKTDLVNVHSKVKIIGESYNQIFSKESTIMLLIDYYSYIEKYDENSGFYDKELIRFHITKSIIEYIQPTIRSNSPRQLEKSYSLKEIDNINSRLLVFSKLESHKLSSFITLIVSELIENFTNLEFAYKNLINYTKKDITNIYKYVNNFDNIILIYKLIHIIITNKDIGNPFVINKFCELIKIKLTFSIKNRLYCQLNQFNESMFNKIGIFDERFIEKIDNFYQSFFYDLFVISDNDDFINAFIDNDSLYDRDCIEETEKLVGFIHNKKLNTSISTILTNFMNIMDNRLFIKNKTLEKYDEDIPAEFVDPIYYIPIENPVEMPNTKTIVEKKIIMNHLVFNQTNPFDGLPLSRDDFLSYNNQSEVKERLDKFTADFIEWRDLHKI